QSFHFSCMQVIGFKARQLWAYNGLTNKRKNANLRISVQDTTIGTPNCDHKITVHNDLYFNH
ncbi:hypothetical protein ACOQJ6_35470, partial [Klebsiella pneumoniae]|uniref:hypothetical protein n=1 Tax=Klebsiella pneumoniae TaxID=573 RepID=UPI001C6FE092